jgi:hypothetical protein
LPDELNSTDCWRNEIVCLKVIGEARVPCHVIYSLPQGALLVFVEGYEAEKCQHQD